VEQQPGGHRARLRVRARPPRDRGRPPAPRPGEARGGERPS
jgi:hypothetical protein